MSNNYRILLLLVILTTVSCKRQRIASKTSEARGTTAFHPIPLPERLVEDLDFEYLTTRSKLSVAGKLQNIDNASVSIRIKKDSVIWLSVTTLGLEVVRGLITPEKVQILDKFHKVHLSTTYSALTGKLGFPIDFQRLQSILLGSLPLVPAGPTVLAHTEPQGLRLYQEQPPLRIESLIDTSQKKLTQVEAVDQQTDNRLTLFYSDFQALQSYLFPFAVQIHLSVHPKLAPEKTEKSSIQLIHNRVEISTEAVTFPFSIPNNYKSAF